MPKKLQRPYPSIQAWMVATGTNQQQLAKLAGCSEPHLSNVLSKSRRCSLYLALRLSRITNVAIEHIALWPADYEKVG